MYKIKPYETEDYDNVIDLLKITNLFYEATDTKEVFDLKIKDDPESLLVAEINNEIVGFVLIRYDAWASSICHLCSHPTKGKGAGFYLGSKAMGIIKGRGCKLVCSYTEIENGKSVKLQARSGWKNG